MVKSVKSLKFAFLLLSYSTSILLSVYYFLQMNKSVILEIDLFSVSSVSFSFLFVFDKISVSFSMVVTLISGCVFLFSYKYMEEDPFSGRFIWILFSFVASMNLLIFSGSLFFLLLGWDGLGITSFALIIYYESKESQLAGFQTLMINRLGDVIIVLSVFLFLVQGQLSIFSMGDSMFYCSGIIILLCIAALTKSAQFPFSSWLPAAMAAPTPVSALVHSSTLVTAGIFIIIRLSYSFPLNESICSMLLFCGSVTCLLGGWAATYENDIKKIIALSTLSQLGVMIFSLGMNFPALSLFHLYTHALFKALLFLAAGHILMITFGSQDIRMMGGVGVLVPFTCVMFNISSLCLVGAPFMSAFYSKHMILEKMLMSSVNFISVLVMMIGTFMTAKYVSRTLKAVSWNKTNSPVLLNYSGLYTSLPVLILALGAMMGGKFILSLDISNFNFGFLPMSHSMLINMITVVGIYMGLIEDGLEKKSFVLSTLFFLTPLIYGTTKPFSLMVLKMKILDQGWIEPYFLIKNKMVWVSSKFTSLGNWPQSRIMISSFFFVFCFLNGTLFSS
uniref:NADH-ubiquinone oxidoreductase chain 5 n=1 Tax=Phyllidiella hageni TaxID=2873953 RepID=A0AA96LU33_9GAST|nr:NADH dehydrogenase subunit 5 [Phyllidiella hageni]WNR50670.1 NADH dehydrogenase subunit 5 [Phyllidiella hageni]WNR50683.1 NADH dehydrogenase subunit 5 [Phyllidiella hageni]WNR50696.1 NADH dehydrogenase subunit 5 [Phyllidiella hageni]